MLKYYSILFLLFLLASCDDVVEDNLDGKSVTIISPADSIVTTSTSIQFNWEELDEATGYRLQIAKPNFTQVVELVYDSVVTNTTVTFSLSPGQYQWRLRPENGSSYGNYITRYIEIDSTSDLTNQEIVLQSPVNGLTTNETEVDFSWYSLYNATQYSFVLRYDDINGSLVLPEEVTTSTSLSITGLEEGQYAWGVRGEAALTNTAYTYRSFLVDLTAPVSSTLVAPINNVSTTSPVFFDWNRSTDNGSNVYDSLFVYSDTNLSNLIWSTSVDSDSVSHSLNTGTYYWRLRTRDVAGNAASYTSAASFYVQ